ncbi:hypothetical protein [Methylobacterium sp. SI9]|uniref:hypothetical protein n=1 Tax=Methylobacterium guangdongense TaxID=3138811 RepID=UPI00313D50E3
MRDDVVSFQLSGSVLEKVRVRARQAGISEDQLVRDVLDEVLELGEARAIVAVDCVEEEGEFVVDCGDGENDADFQTRSKLYADLFGPDR